MKQFLFLWLRSFELIYTLHITQTEFQYLVFTCSSQKMLELCCDKSSIVYVITNINAFHVIHQLIHYYILSLVMCISEIKNIHKYNENINTNTMTMKWMNGNIVCYACIIWIFFCLIFTHFLFHLWMMCTIKLCLLSMIERFCFIFQAPNNLSTDNNKVLL